LVWASCCLMLCCTTRYSSNITIWLVSQ
jgi:hypothetical protein